jgi:small GTP-binding protein
MKTMTQGPSVRAVLVGDSQVGKTSIIHYLVRGSFESDQKNTVGGVFHTMSRDVDGHPIRMEVWDTAGQEKFRSIGPIYYRGASVAIAVFDLSNENFATGLEEWMLNVKRNTVDPMFFVVGNKLDLVEYTPELNEQVKRFAEKWNAPYFFTSAKTGENIHILFDAVFKAVQESCVISMPKPPQEVAPKVEQTSCC